MITDELKQHAAECLGKAFKGDGSIPPHIVQAAVAILLTVTAEPKR